MGVFQTKPGRLAASGAQAGSLREDDETSWRRVWDGPTDPLTFHIEP